MRFVVSALLFTVSGCAVTELDPERRDLEGQALHGEPPALASTAFFSGAFGPGAPSYVAYCGGIEQGQAACTEGDPVQVRWGVAAGETLPSGLGYSPTLEPVQSFDEFVIGTLTHYNFPMWSYSTIQGVRLDLGVELQTVGGEPLFDEGVAVDLVVDETTNAEPCFYPSVTPCADRVGIALGATPAFTARLDGWQYTLTILGFRSGPLDSMPYFLSEEHGSTTAFLYASLTDSCIDDDADGACDFEDNCAGASNPLQEDADGDGPGDACDACPQDAANDADLDGACGDVDNCPTANPDQLDSDGDGEGDACDACPLNDCDPCPCDAEWKNHGDYVSCVAHATQEQVEAGELLPAERGQIVSEAGRSECGKKQ